MERIEGVEERERKRKRYLFRHLSISHSHPPLRQQRESADLTDAPSPLLVSISVFLN